MDEFQFIDSITPFYYRQSSLLKGIGDDTAVIRPPTGFDLVTAVDTMVEDVHFSLNTMDPYHVGYRALAANISDLAAMGSSPAYYMVSLVIPNDWTPKQLEGIYKGMNELAQVYNMDLIGGDTVSGKQLVLSITVYGFVPYDKSRYRSHAKENDIVFVTGTLGDSAYGLYLLQNGENIGVEQNYFVQRHRMPTPRVKFAQKLQTFKRVCLNDISDGIANEANEIAAASNIDLYLEYEDIPIKRQLKKLPNSTQREFILSGGEDFELIGTACKEDWENIKQIALNTDTEITAIGYTATSQGKSSVFLSKDNKTSILNKTGYTHLLK
ncbi:thiamine-monophosphate kinase [Salirhabdus euzebyi]|uniref:Thiamine-monophosphate kinase n=1 Tax=Salirhabdus euzebyi TaxID=394506 RepID=A0A841Q9D0_9BACI|nr:thiamine-phosphate kinase [Salirhabdus euzebyi]MBB6454857.1 thiamine-monophosphate kinase [Salirhabdus euzebyi]